MKKTLLTLCLGLLAVSFASGGIYKVLSGVAVNGTTNTSSVTFTNAVYPPSQNIIIDTTGNQTNYLQVSLDNTNFVSVATNIVSTGSSTTNFQPAPPATTLYYRVLMTTTNNTTNTVYISN